MRHVTSSTAIAWRSCGTARDHQLRPRRHRGRRRVPWPRSNAGQLHAYVSDFPTPALIEHPKVIALPHLGASTAKRRRTAPSWWPKTCATISRTATSGSRSISPRRSCRALGAYRITVANANVPNMVGQISTCLAEGQSEYRGPAQQVLRRSGLHDRRPRRTGIR